MMQNEYMEGLSEATGCMISVRGIHLDGTRRNLNAQRLHIHIEGTSKNEVNIASSEIRKILDEYSGLAEDY